MLAWRGRLIFNPAAFGVALTYFALNRAASWWVGSAALLPFVVVGGVLVARKLGRFDQVASFLIVALAGLGVVDLFQHTDLFASFQKAVLYSPLIFFATIILIEPLTTPPTRKLRILYGAVVGILFVPGIHLGTLFVTPELAILLGNVLAFRASPTATLRLPLKERVQLGNDTYEFIFSLPEEINHSPGQYMEWTLAHPDTDARGNRRYFTVSSAPTERTLRLAI